MSIHSDPRRNSLDEEEYREWQRDLRNEYAEEQPIKLPCGFATEDGSCTSEEICPHQYGKWKDLCGRMKVV